MLWPPEDDKKVLCQLLPKLYLPDSADDDKVKELKVLMYTLRSVCSFLERHYS